MSGECVKEDEKMFRDLAEKCPVGVFLFQDGELKYVNPKFAEMHGYTMDEIARVRQTKDLVHPDDLPQLERHIRRRLAGEPTPEQIVFRGITKNGEIVYIANYDCGHTTSHGHAAIIGTAVDVTERRKTEEELKKYREHLEELVEERTLQLSRLNQKLQRDIEKRKEMEETLKIKSLSLEELNTALKVLLKQREADRRELEEKIASNVNELVLRFVRMFRGTTLDQNQSLLVDIVEKNLSEIISKFPNEINRRRFIPKEMEVIFLLRDGMTTKQIAQLLNVSMDAISRHRYHIRKKLGMNKDKGNLHSHLMSLT
ncbi:MAG: PAS domain S-box protein [Syntrophorhabdales bacterium]